ncbi:MAG: imidazolonepropionase [Phycisphaerales bacterium]|nr:imidazolonepropionase [Phycisphaerales bacterium]
MSDFIIINARILTLDNGDLPRRGEEMQDLGVIESGFVLILDGKIDQVKSGVPDETVFEKSDELVVIDACGRVLMPTFVDCHTHSCWAGSRLDEFEAGLQGVPYLELLANGGGIMSTVKAVREASQEDLAASLVGRVALMASMGTTTVEVKSGYGLTTNTELKMLRAVHDASQEIPQLICGTFLGAHAIDPSIDNFATLVIEETLPAVADEFPNITCDAYCEEGSWSVKDTTKLFERAIDLGCPIRAHVDQFNALGMLTKAIELGAVSVDHLEHSTDKELKLLAKSSTIGVLLPASGFCLNDAYARGRTIIDFGCAVAIASNFNPGSSPMPSMPFAIALACRRLGLTPSEAITASTVNAACVLGLQEKVGRIRAGFQGDVQLLDCEDERELAWQVCGGGPLLVSIDGEIVHLLSEGEPETKDEGGG